MALLDVNAPGRAGVGLHVHHAAIRSWFVTDASAGWASCPVTESGFVRVSSIPEVLPAAIGVEPSVRCSRPCGRHAHGHEFLLEDVSLTPTTCR